MNVRLQILNDVESCAQHAVRGVASLIVGRTSRRFTRTEPMVELSLVVFSATPSTADAVTPHLLTAPQPEAWAEIATLTEALLDDPGDALRGR